MKKSLITLLVCSLLIACAPADQETSAADGTPAATSSTTARSGGTAPARDTAEAVATLAAADATPSPTTQPREAPAARSDIVAGRHYEVLNPVQPTSSQPDQVEVAEIYMPSCPHCYSFEPFIHSYLADKPAYVNFVAIPASFNKMAALHARAVYAAEVLGVREQLHEEMFKAIHVEKNRLDNEDAVIAFFVANGVSAEDTASALKSFAVDTKVRRADGLVRRYRISSVPSLVINGKYVTSGSMTGSTQKLREVVDYLVGLEAAQL